MKIKDGFVRREVAGNNVVVAVGEASEKFNGMMKLNETGCFLWEKLEGGITRDELVNSLLEAYNVDKDTASVGVDKFIAELEKLGCIEK